MSVFMLKKTKLLPYDKHNNKIQHTYTLHADMLLVRFKRPLLINS